jgi:hypothetical protein
MSNPKDFYINDEHHMITDYNLLLMWPHMYWHWLAAPTFKFQTSCMAKIVRRVLLEYMSYTMVLNMNGTEVICMSIISNQITFKSEARDSHES